MSEEAKLKIIQELAKNGVKIHQLILEYSGTTIIKNGEEGNQNCRDYQKLSKESLAEVIIQAQQYFWGNSSYAVLFCLLRDFYRYPDNRTKYEKDMQGLPYIRKPEYVCTLGVVSSTFSDNPYMKLHIDKWEQNGAGERVLQLVEKLKIALDERY